MSNTIRTLLSVAFALFFAAPAQALYIIDVEQFGNDVTATGSGSIPTFGSYMDVYNGRMTNSGISDGSVVIGRPNLADLRMSFAGSVTGDFAFGATYSPADYGFGPIVGIAVTSLGAGTNNMFLTVPTGYTWGTELDLSLSTWYNTTLYDLGLTPGTFSFMAGYSNREVLKVNVIGSSPVPLPPALGLFCIGLAGLGYRFKDQWFMHSHDSRC